MDVTEFLSQASGVEEIYREAMAMKKLDHKNIIRLFNAFVEKKDVIMIIEYCAGGELFEYVSARNGVDEVTARIIIN
jgi:calcium-dependent protein kinase